MPRTPCSVVCAVPPAPGGAANPQRVADSAGALCALQSAYTPVHYVRRRRRSPEAKVAIARAGCCALLPAEAHRAIANPMAWPACCIANACVSLIRTARLLVGSIIVSFFWKGRRAGSFARQNISRRLCQFRMLIGAMCPASPRGGVLLGVCSMTKSTPRTMNSTGIVFGVFSVVEFRTTLGDIHPPPLRITGRRDLFAAHERAALHEPRSNAAARLGRWCPEWHFSVSAWVKGNSQSTTCQPAARSRATISGFLGVKATA